MFLIFFKPDLIQLNYKKYSFVELSFFILPKDEHEASVFWREGAELLKIKTWRTESSLSFWNTEKKNNNMQKKLIGRIEKADFPELGLSNISVKIDTGAYTSSIHCAEIVEENNTLTCLFLDKEHDFYNKKKLTFTEYKQVIVKSSNGVAQNRYIIQSKIKIFGKVYPISLSLSDRSDMKYPVLIGRKFLNKKFIVDPQYTNLSEKGGK